MTNLAIECTPSAHEAPLSIGQILDHGLATSPQQEIVYGDRLRHSYVTFAERVRRLASALAKLGVVPGNTVAVMDWDSHRYLECFFAVPMMGAVLHTVNIRISPEQILYTINHANDDVILVNAEFLPIIEAIHAKIRPGVKLVLINDGAEAPKTGIPFAAEYESMLAAASPSFDFPALDDDTRATTFYTTGTTGLPKGVYYSHRQLVLHTLAVTAALANAPHATFTSGDVYMPITPMFHVHAWGLPYVATMLGVKQVYPGRYVPDVLVGLIGRERVTFSHCVPTILQMMLAQPGASRCRPARMEGHHRRLCAADLARPHGGRAWHRHHRRLRHVRDLPDPDARAPAAAHARLGCGGAATLSVPRRTADPVRAAPHRRRTDERRSARRREPGRSRRSLAVADAGLPRRIRSLRGTVERRLAAHR